MALDLNPVARKRLKVTISEALYARLHQASEVSKRTKSELVEEMIDAHIPTKEKMEQG